jgi:antitoxin PrlF
MNSVATIEKTCTITRKGQTTLPLAIRQLLGVPDGGRIVVRAEGRRVIIEPAAEEHRDPAIGAFLRLMAAEIESAHHVGAMPNDLAAALERVLDEIDIDLDAPIEGDVCL